MTYWKIELAGSKLADYIWAKGIIWPKMY